MKLSIQWVIAGLVFAAAASFFLFQNRKEKQSPHIRSVLDHARQDVNTVKGIEGYISYPAGTFELPFSFRLPGNWTTGTTTGKSADYRQIIVQGPRNNEDTYTASLVILSAPVQNKPPYGSMESLISASSRIYSPAHDGRLILDKTPLVLDGSTAVKVEGSFQTNTPVRTGKAKRVTVKQIDIFTERQDRLYKMSFSADERDFRKYDEVLKELLSSVRWKS